MGSIVSASAHTQRAEKVKLPILPKAVFDGAKIVMFVALDSCWASGPTNPSTP